MADFAVTISALQLARAPECDLVSIQLALYGAEDPQFFPFLSEICYFPFPLQSARTFEFHLPKTLRCDVLRARLFLNLCVGLGEEVRTLRQLNAELPQIKTASGLNLQLEGCFISLKTSLVPQLSARHGKLLSLPLLEYDAHKWNLPLSRQALQPSHVLVYLTDYGIQLPLLDGSTTQTAIFSEADLIKSPGKSPRLVLWAFADFLNCQYPLFQLSVEVGIENFTIEHTSIAASVSVPRVRPTAYLCEAFDYMLYFSADQGQQQLAVFGVAEAFSKLASNQRALAHLLVQRLPLQERRERRLESVFEPLRQIRKGANTNLHTEELFANLDVQHCVGTGAITFCLQLAGEKPPANGGDLQLTTNYTDQDGYGARLIVQPVSCSGRVFGVAHARRDAFEAQMPLRMSAVDTFEGLYISFPRPDSLSTLVHYVQTISEYIFAWDLQSAELSERLKALVPDGEQSTYSVYQRHAVLDAIVRPSVLTISLDRQYDCVHVFKNDIFQLACSCDLQAAVDVFHSFCAARDLRDKLSSAPNKASIRLFPPIESVEEAGDIQVVEAGSILFLEQLAGINLRLQPFQYAGQISKEAQTEFHREKASQTGTVKGELEYLKTHDYQKYLALKKRCFDARSQRAMAETTEYQWTKQLVKRLRKDELYAHGLESFQQAAKDASASVPVRHQDYFWRLCEQAISRFAYKSK